MVADLIARPVEAYPEKGKLVLVDEMRLDTGGCAANTAVVLRRLGVSAAVMGRVGADGLGDFVVESLRRNGVDVSSVRRDPVKGTGSSMVLTGADGERSFISTLGANTAVCTDDIDWARLKESKVLHVGGALLLPALDGEPTAAVLKQAKELGLVTSVDTAWDYEGRWWRALEACLPYIDLLLPSYDEARMLAGEEDPADIAASFLRAGAHVVALKMGSRGSYVRTNEVEVTIPAFPVRTVDANGAGDAYVAGFLAGWLRGLPLVETARLANAVGALATTAVGATAGVKDLEEALALAGTARASV